MNKPRFEVLNVSNENSFLMRIFEEEAFSSPYHFHPEYELTLIVKGCGKRYVGDHMTNYTRGDLVLLGSNLPHCWKTDNIILNELNAKSFVVQFSEDFLGDGFFHKPEFTTILKLLQRSNCGIQFVDKTQAEVEQKIITLFQEANNFKKIILFIEILQLLSLSVDFVLLSNPQELAIKSDADQERINPIFAYIVENFRQGVSLNEAASIANMTPNSFCKYFKKITHKTFMGVVIEYRISYALQQLAHTKKTISEICFDSGFTDISQFHKVFKHKMNVSPFSYRKKFNN